MAIRELPAETRPRERLAAHGPGSLNPIELLAILIGSGTRSQSALDLAKTLLGKFGSLRELSAASLEQISEAPGIGPARATGIVAAFEIGKRVAIAGQGEETVIHGPKDVYDLLLLQLRDERREIFKGVFLNTKNAVIRIVDVSIGTLDASLVSPRELFRQAIRDGCKSVIIAHNHPSGDPTPSPEDRLVTHRLVKAGEIIGIDILDHVVIGDGRFASLKERGEM